MKKTATKILLIFGIFMFLHEYSFSQFTLSGELRPRFEYRNGFKRLPDTLSEFAAFVSQRSRICFDYKTDKIKTKISFQDVGVWGSEKFKTDSATVGLYEAWAEIPLCDSLSLKVGKQEISYDNERLFGICNWNQLGNTHNAAMLKYHKNGLQIDFTGAFNQAAENLFGTGYPTYPGNYKTLNILWVSKQFTEQFKASLLGVADGYQRVNSDNTLYMRGTYGGILNYIKEGKYSAAVRGFYQDGRLQTGKQVSAYYFSADLTCNLSSKFILWAGLQYSSGNDGTNLNNTKSDAFNTLYGTQHKFGGNMEYFSSISTATKGAGLVDPYLNFIYNLNEKAYFRLDLHYLALQNNYVVNVTPIDKTLGGEADLSFNYNFTKEFSLMAGFSGNIGTKSMEVIVGGNSIYPGGWGFVMLTFKPVFFKSEKK